MDDYEEPHQKEERYQPHRSSPYKYHDIETEEHAKRDPYIAHGEESEEEDYGEELPCHHTFDEDEDLFSNNDEYYDD